MGSKSISNFNSRERCVTLALISIMLLRSIGLFIVIPIFSPLAAKFAGSNPTKIGVALGIYGLMQLVFQIPFGILSDKFGRKLIILVGLLLFVGGSFIAASAVAIEQVIIGRALQGVGAIGSVIMAFAADLVREELRLKVIAALGMTIGSAFGLSVVLGPVLGLYFGKLTLVFGCGGLLGIIAIVILYFVPQQQNNIATKLMSKNNMHNNIINMQMITAVFLNKKLIFLAISTLLLHIVMTAMFYLLPLLMQQHMGIDKTIIYGGTFVGGMLVTGLILATYKQQLGVKVLVISLAASICTFLYIVYFTKELNKVFFIISLTSFFTCFNLLEAMLPAAVTKVISQQLRGTAMGFYAAAQFLGLFLGGFLAGIIDEYSGTVTVLYFCCILVCVWGFSLLFFDFWKKQRGLYGTWYQ